MTRSRRWIRIAMIAAIASVLNVIYATQNPVFASGCSGACDGHEDCSGASGLCECFPNPLGPHCITK